MNTEKDPKKDPELLQKIPEKREKKGSIYISKRTGLKYKRIHISLPKTVYDEILEEITREYGKPSPRKISELLIRAFYYYKNKYTISLDKKTLTKEPETKPQSEIDTKPQPPDLTSVLDRIFKTQKIPASEKLKEKFVKVLYQICVDRISTSKTNETIEECVLTIHQIPSTQLESSIIKAIGHDPRTIEGNVEAFVKSGLLLLQTQNPEKNIKIYTITMNEDERKEYLARILARAKTTL